MKIMKQIFLKNSYQTTKYLSSKLFLEGKSYKISFKQTIVNMRFNRANRQVLVLKNTKFFNKNGQKKLYILNQNLIRKPLAHLTSAIRPIDTYTLRGLWCSNKVIGKRSGRISEYM